MRAFIIVSASSMMQQAQEVKRREERAQALTLHFFARANKPQRHTDDSSFAFYLALRVEDEEMEDGREDEEFY